MNKEVKIKVWFDESSHYQEMNKAHEIAAVFKAAKQELETIISKPIEDFSAFRNDILQYSISEITKVYPAAFNLQLGLQKTLSMLSINLRKIEEYDAILSTTPYNINVCSKTGEATPNDDTSPFCYYAETPDQLNRLRFCNDLIANLEKCHEYAPHRGKHNLVNSLVQFVYLDPQLGLVPNHHFVLNSIQ